MVVNHQKIQKMKKIKFVVLVKKKMSSYLEKWHRSSQSRNVATFNMTTSNWLNEYSSTENTWGIVDDDDDFVDVVTSSFTLFVIFLELWWWWWWCGVAVFTGFDDCDGGCGGIDAENENGDESLGGDDDVGEWDERGDDDRKLLDSERLTLLANRSNSMCANELTCKWWWWCDEWWWSWLLLLSMSLVELSVELSSFSCKSKIVFLLLSLLGDIVVVDVVVVGDCCGWSLRRWLISSSETPALVLLADPIFFVTSSPVFRSLFSLFLLFSLVVCCCVRWFCVLLLGVRALRVAVGAFVVVWIGRQRWSHKVTSRCVVWDGMDRQLSLFSFRRKGSRAFGDSFLPNHACTHPVGIIVIHHISLDHWWGEWNGKQGLHLQSLL